MVLRGTFMKVLFHRIANVAQNPMYQLSFHNITTSITSCVEAEWHTFACARIVLIAFEFSKGCSFSNLIKTSCHITPKNSMDKEDIAADVFTFSFLALIF